jgi:histone deacetylase HOS3
MGLNESSHAEDLLIAGGKPLPPMTAEEEQRGRRRRNWKGFYGSVHDIVSLARVLTVDTLVRQELR